MRIGLNLLHAQRSLGGAWNYIENVVETLQRHDHENEYVLYCNQESRLLVRECPRFRVVFAKADMRRRLLRVACEQTWLNWKSRRDELDVMHWFANNSPILPGVPSVATIHDLLALSYPRSKRFLNGIYIRSMLRNAACNATLIAPVSQTTADEITRWYNVPREKMVILPNMLSDRFSPIEDVSALRRFRNKYRLPERFWVFVSVYRKHKNHERLFEALRRLKRLVSEPWPLALRCDRSSGDAILLDDMIRRNEIEREVIWLPRLEADEMPLLFATATASVFPSLFEGGGIPVMEAMGCGCPVASSDIPTSREFGQDAAVYFDPYDVESMANAMAILQNEPLRRSVCRQRGLEMVSNLRSETIFPRLMDAYRLACRERVRRVA